MKMYIFYYVLLFFIYIIGIKDVRVECRKKYHIKKILKGFTNKLIYNEIRGKNSNSINSVIYKRNILFHIRIPKKTLQGRNLFSNDIRNKKINEFLQKKKNSCYLHINSNVNEIKKKRDRILKNVFINAKLLQEYFNNFKSSLLYKYKNTKIITKLFLSTSFLVMILNVFGLRPEDIALHAKRIIRAFEFYRIITSALFYGDISLYVLTNIYMLYLQSQELEKSVGSSETLAFYLSQITILSAICSYIKKPFYSTALLKSLLFTNCMLNPYNKSNLIFGINIYNMYLPYLSIVIDILHAQDFKASLSGILGIISGYIYYISNIYLLEKCNKKFFKIPQILRNYLDSFNTDEFVF
ncbi:degradation in the ER (DER1) like protein, putative [Plasmodium berghei]|uniref:Derlin n=2 Tax=Plasmodium berghei TaxID=5821 RepID=A0A509APG2_PLABA|nr:DER1-like protein, putative [Plasmodium berghei ANKA]CXI91753.1 degradation in the ER (DER1) like protein, putative [Plasmodium berghei]SCL96503.1 degradation in the ER (DER1) like protein, putative [Plasmodium berghei]SCM16435.1 degradation in the ER (DER1) like protein, putative [Plasmodium berghei]SCN27657.1 degradation in the ER (DER1) like protein, putative [Plasmodium berghei]VUC57541.1 DER1-like protein, putative [Plasmodium berghei ANKA]|eukprot:XP_034423312.1 DER1-like protein, putative [Plasmodium berghei ANKA]